MYMEVSMCIYGVLSLTKVELPTFRSMVGDERSGSLQFAAFLHILLNIYNYYHNEEFKSVIG